MSKRHYKILVIGDIMVGKTSFVSRYVDDSFTGLYKTTFGADYKVKIVQLEDSRMVRLHFWDIAGQERFISLTRVYYKDAQGCIVICDVTNKDSLARAIDWKQDLDSKCRQPDGSPIPTLLLGNKIDLISNRTVSDEELAQHCNDYGFTCWSLVSARTGENIPSAMHTFVKLVTTEDQYSDDEFSNFTESKRIILEQNHSIKPSKQDECACQVA